MTCFINCNVLIALFSRHGCLRINVIIIVNWFSHLYAYFQAFRFRFWCGSWAVIVDAFYTSFVAMETVKVLCVSVIFVIQVRISRGVYPCLLKNEDNNTNNNTVAFTVIYNEMLINAHAISTVK